MENKHSLGNKVSFLKYILTCAIGFGIGGAIWGWFFGSAAYFGNPGSVVFYWFNGILLGILGGLCLFILTQNKRNIFLNILLGGLSGFIAFFVGHYVGFFVLNLFIIPALELFFSLTKIKFGGPQLLHFFSYGEGLQLAFASFILITTYLGIIEGKLPSVFPKNKKIIFLDLIILIIGSISLLFDYRMFVAILIFIFYLNYILSINNNFFPLILISILGFPLSYNIGFLIVDIVNYITQRSVFDWLLWSYILRFTTSGILFGLLVGWVFKKAQKLV